MADQFPLHVVTDWIGNSPDIAERHYLKTTEEHFKKAVGGQSGGEDPSATQNPPQQIPAGNEVGQKTQKASSLEDELKDYVGKRRGKRSRLA